MATRKACCSTSGCAPPNSIRGARAGTKNWHGRLRRHSLHHPCPSPQRISRSHMFDRTIDLTAGADPADAPLMVLPVEVVGLGLAPPWTANRLNPTPKP
jgi:hypothetical protein